MTGDSLPTPVSTYADAAPVYALDGWPCVVPLAAGTKFPPPNGFTGWAGVDTSGPDIYELAEVPRYQGTTQTALRMPPTVVGIDVDHYDGKRGGDTLAEAERRWGPLPVGPWSSARDDGVSGIRFLRVPAGTVLAGGIAFPELDLNGDAAGIEIVQRHHRYAVVWPSIHPSTGTPYTWRGTAGPGLGPRVDELPELPAAWVDALRNDSARPGRLAVDDAAVSAFLAEHTTGSRSHRGVLSYFRNRGQRKRSARHDAMLDCVNMAARESAAGQYPAAAVFAELWAEFWAAVSGDGKRTEATAQLEYRGAVRWAVGQLDGLSAAEVFALTADGRRSPEDRFLMGGDRATLPTVEMGAAAGSPDAAGQPGEQLRALRLPILPESFWATLAVLDHIRTAAHARLVSADLALHVVLAKLAARRGHELWFDTGRGRTSLNYFAALVALSGIGKSTGAAAVDDDLMPLPACLTNRTDDNPEEDVYREIPGGSGEGIAEAYIGEVEVKVGETSKGEPKTKKVRRQVRHNAFISIDEGEALVRTGERTGATVLTTLRSAWVGETIGQANGRAETTRVVKRGTYSLGMIVGFQPNTALPLLAETAGGTAQRFPWVSAADPTIPDEPVEHPGSLPDVLTDAEFAHTLRTGRIGFPDHVVAQLRADHLAKVRGEVVVAPEDSHEPLMRCKMAALLALLDGQSDVADVHWELAGVMWRTSCAVRDVLVEHGRQQQARDREAVAREKVALAERIKAVEGQVDKKLLRLAKVLGEHVVEAKGLGRAAARKVLNSRDRDLYEQIVELGESLGLFRRDPGTDVLLPRGDELSTPLSTPGVHPVSAA